MVSHWSIIAIKGVYFVHGWVCQIQLVSTPLLHVVVVVVAAAAAVVVT